MSSQQYTSWGKYPYFPQTAHHCQWRSELTQLLPPVVEHHKTILPYGNGRSYGDSCLAVSDHVIALSGLNKWIAADWSTGVIQCEAGTTLADIISHALPKGWFLPVTPGTQYVTLGGAVANDVHGKNHHCKGAFGCHILRFSLLRSDGVEYICSPAEHTQLFSATIGGLGLTGIIQWVELQLMPVESNQIDSTTIRFNSLKEFFSLSNELDQQYEYSAAWIDCLAKNNQLGRGVYFAGNHASSGDLAVTRSKNLRFPFVPPFSLVNTVTLKAFNALYFAKHSSQAQSSHVHYQPFFYPLDGVLHWNNMYGKAGFQQYQCVIPNDQAYAVIKEMLVFIAQQGCGSFLVVLKRCGDILSPGMLSFPMPGISLAIDFPQSHRLKTLFPLLDHLVSEAGGRLYPAKDAHMTAHDFQKSYPQWTDLESLRDPALCSRFWQRVTEQ